MKTVLMFVVLSVNTLLSAQDGPAPVVFKNYVNDVTDLSVPIQDAKKSVTLHFSVYEDEILDSMRKALANKVPIRVMFWHLEQGSTQPWDLKKEGFAVFSNGARSGLEFKKGKIPEDMWKKHPDNFALIDDIIYTVNPDKTVSIAKNAEKLKQWEYFFLVHQKDNHNTFLFPQPPEGQPAIVPPVPVFIGNILTNTYHKIDCSTLNLGKVVGEFSRTPTNLRNIWSTKFYYFSNLEEAAMMRYDSCTVCKPNGENVVQESVAKNTPTIEQPAKPASTLPVLKPFQRLALVLKDGTVVKVMGARDLDATRYLVFFPDGKQNIYNKNEVTFKVVDDFPKKKR